MILVGLDTETSGLSQEKGAKIIEIALLTYEFNPATNEYRLVETYEQRVDPQQPIEAGAQEVHGIAYSDLVGCPPWEDVADEVVTRMNKAHCLVAHNMNFDGPFIAAELLRVGREVPNVDAVCTMESGRWACPDGKLPKLSELCFALGVDYDHAMAHGASYDVQVMMECLFRGIARGFYKLPDLVTT